MLNLSGILFSSTINCTDFTAREDAVRNEPLGLVHATDADGLGAIAYTGGGPLFTAFEGVVRKRTADQFDFETE